MRTTNQGAHGKGGIEGEVEGFRRTFPATAPVVDSLGELNEKLRVLDDSEDGRRISHRLRPVGQDFALEAPLLASLPAGSFDPGPVLTPKVDRSSLVTLRSAK